MSERVTKADVEGMLWRALVEQVPGVMDHSDLTLMELYARCEEFALVSITCKSGQLRIVRREHGRVRDERQAGALVRRLLAPLRRIGPPE